MKAGPLFAGLTALLFLGCSTQQESTPDGTSPFDDSITLVLWDFGGVPGHRAWIKKALIEYEAINPGVHIKRELRDWPTQRESLISATLAREGPDILRVHHKYSVEFGELGGLYPLDHFADFAKVRKQLLDNVWEHVEYEGSYYGVPIFILPFVMPVNHSLLQAHDLTIPTTWSELRALGAPLAASGIHTLVMPGGLNLDTAYRFMALVYRAGGRVLNDDWTAAAFNGPAGVAALEFLVGLKEDGYLPEAGAAYRSDESEAHWSMQKAVLAIEGPWWQSVVSNHYQFDLANLRLASIPTPDESFEDNEPRTLLDVAMFSITGYTKSPDQAWEVVKALTIEDPVWRKPDPTMGGLPAMKAAYSGTVESDYIDLGVLADAGANGLCWPSHPSITEIQHHVANAVNMALTGVRTPQEALDAAASEVNALLRSD